MNELQRCEFDILKEVILVLEQLKLPYFLIGGSALGAVKYQGFIPWDDDIDLGLCRKDYEVFLQKGQKLLPEHLFLQNFHTDPGCAMLYSKVRNSNTTYIEKSSARMDINHGVYIDIFPLDGYPVLQEEQRALEQRKRKHKLISECGFDFSRSTKEKLVVCILRLLGFHKRSSKTLSAYEKMVSSFDVGSSELICNHGNWKGKREYVPKEYYGEGCTAVFEGISVRIPQKYDEYLTQKYGDWRADPPVEEQIGHHYYEVCDLEKPYTYYMTQDYKEN